MTFKVILSVTGVNHGEADLIVAAELCRQVDAHLSFLIIGLAAPPPIGEYAAMVSDAWLEERRADTVRLDERLSAVRSFRADNVPSADMESKYSEVTFADEAIGRSALSADLVVAGPELLAGDLLKSKVIEGVLFSSGRPLLLAPSGSRPTLRPKRVVVAWNSSLEASRAVHEAIGILEGAQQVHVVMVDPVTEERGGGEPGGDIAAFLIRHGVKVVVDRIPSMGQKVEEVLRRHAVDTSAELLVMGGYGHSRLRERVFGGVTRSMLQDTPMPILMAR
ncbi:universal stress protein [Mesorhizobium sp. L-8-10]|uniref:universal stress protein n=1 Tax=Mesorhizobium sp. L-8-10 TaxID=2744523 RepID=UPI001926D84A|nr:universal stress protein [Mesorhizobium sp. L-8-10]BCH31933.1 universal stress protein [Mesorhizobium sp. L-8-10]